MCVRDTKQEKKGLSPLSVPVFLYIALSVIVSTHGTNELYEIKVIRPTYQGIRHMFLT